jgi:hypothetical protein
MHSQLRLIADQAGRGRLAAVGLEDVAVTPLPPERFADVLAPDGLQRFERTIARGREAARVPHVLKRRLHRPRRRGSGATAVLRASGLAADHHRPPRSVFERLDGSVGSVVSEARLTEEQALRLDVPLLAQMSRWDRRKDPLGVLAAFAEHVSADDEPHLLLLEGAPGRRRHQDQIEDGRTCYAGHLAAGFLTEAGLVAEPQGR